MVLVLQTDGRDYDTYLDLMSNDDVVDTKYDDISEFIRPGTIVGDGCGDGALLTRVADDYQQSRLCCVELSDEMIRRFQQRKEHGQFGDATATDRKSSILEPLDGLVPDTIIASSVTHELWSYYDGGDTIDDYLGRCHDQLKDGGRLIIRDVIGPDHPDQEVLAWFDGQDGTDTDIYADIDDRERLNDHLDGLSTRSRFHRFLDDFEARYLEEDPHITPVEMHDTQLYPISADTFSEYALTKDYTDNWENEMRESFAFWSQEDYETALEDAGFDIIHSRTYTNPWIGEDRFEGRIEQYRETEDGIEKIGPPPTNIVIVGQK